jgi:hypothetical protein
VFFKKFGQVRNNAGTRLLELLFLALRVDNTFATRSLSG